MELPAHIQRAFIARASGASWIQCAEVANTSTANLRKWRQHPLADGYIQEAIDLNISVAHSKLAEAAPALVDRLIHLGLSEDVKPYAQVPAINSALDHLSRGVTEKQNRELLIKLRTSVESLEGGKHPDVINVESE